MAPALAQVELPVGRLFVVCCCVGCLLLLCWFVCSQVLWVCGAEWGPREAALLGQAGDRRVPELDDQGGSVGRGGLWG